MKYSIGLFQNKEKKGTSEINTNNLSIYIYLSKIEKNCRYNLFVFVGKNGKYGIQKGYIQSDSNGFFNNVITIPKNKLCCDIKYFNEVSLVLLIPENNSHEILGFNGEKFEFSILIKGICKTLTACLSLIIVAYVCTIIDLSSLGFQPQTAITSGILVYSAKLIRNAMGLLGLNKEGKEDKDNIDPLSKIKKEEINNVESIDDDFEQVEIPNDDKQDDNSIAVG